MACRRRRCRENAAQKANKQVAALPQSTLVTLPGESARLWNHVTFGTGTCVGMIEGYLALEMPGDPLPSITGLRDRLNKVIETLEARNADSSSESP